MGNKISNAAMRRGQTGTAARVYHSGIARRSFHGGATRSRDTQAAPHPMRGLGGNFARSSRPDVRAAFKRALGAVARRDAEYAEAQADAWKGR